MGDRLTERRARTQATYEQQAADFLSDRLLPGEAIRSVTFVMKDQRSGVDWYFLVLTDRRIVLVALPEGLPTDVVWAEPFTGVVVEKFKRERRMIILGRQMILLYLRRLSDGQVIGFATPPAGSVGVTERLTEVADTLNRARADNPERPDWMRTQE